MRFTAERDNAGLVGILSPGRNDSVQTVCPRDIVPALAASVHYLGGALLHQNGEPV